MRPQRRPSLIQVRTITRQRPKKKKKNVPVTQKAHQNLTNNDTNDFQVLHGVDPLLIANLVGIPTVTEHMLEERLDVSDREQHVAVKARDISILSSDHLRNASFLSPRILQNKESLPF